MHNSLSSRSSAQISWFGFFLVLAILTLTIYSVIYIVYPFDDQVNDLILNTVYMLSVLAPAVASLAVLKYYEKGDAPRRIWVYLSIGLWVWFAAELVWIIYNMVMGEVPSVNLSDPLYLAGYFTITLAIVIQYKHINRNNGVSISASVVTLWAVLICATLIIFVLTTSFSNPETNLLDYVGIFLAYFYSNADLGIGITALLIIRAFQSGALGKPWWGFIVLAVSDFFYARLIQTDAYAYETLSGDYLRLASDLIYIVSYFLIAFGLLLHYLLLRFGPPEIKRRVNP